MNAVPLPAAQRSPEGQRRPPSWIRVSKPVTFQLETKTFVTIKTEQSPLIVVEPNKQLFNTNICLLAIGIVSSHRKYRLQDTYSQHWDATEKAKLRPNCRRFSGTSSTNDGVQITNGEVIGDAVEKLYSKRACDVKAAGVINRTLEKNQKEFFGEKKKNRPQRRPFHCQWTRNTTKPCGRC